MSLLLPVPCPPKFLLCKLPRSSVLDGNNCYVAVRLPSVAQVPGARLALVGDGPQRQELEQLFKGMPVKFMVRFVPGARGLQLSGLSCCLCAIWSWMWAALVLLPCV
jgi:hypothetical protein